MGKEETMENIGFPFDLMITPRVQHALNDLQRAYKLRARPCCGNLYTNFYFFVAQLASTFARKGDRLDAEEVIIASFFINILRETDYFTEESLRMNYGTRIASIIRDVSEKKYEGKTRLPWREYKQLYLDQLSQVHYRGAQVVALSYALAGICKVIEEFPSKPQDEWSRVFSSTPQDQIWFYMELLQVIMHNNEQLSEEDKLPPSLMAVYCLRLDEFKSVVKRFNT